MAEARERTRGVLEGIMKVPDAILEPNILNVLRKYVMQGGQPETVVSLLTNHYKGYPEMAKLVCRWLKEATEFQGREEDSAAAAAPCAAAPAAGLAAPCPDEFDLLAEVVRERFQADKLTGVFSAGGRPPQWLDGLISTPRGRRLVYELSAHHTNCLVLSYTIQKILSKGFEDEVSALGKGLASYFGVYHRLVSSRVKAVLQADAAQMPRLVAELADISSQSLPAYCHSQQMIAELGRAGGGGALMRRLFQDLEEAAAQQHGGLVWLSHRLFLGPGMRGCDLDAAVLVGELLASRNMADITDLHELYIRHPRSDSGLPMPCLSILRHPKLLDLMVESLFNPKRAIKGEARSRVEQLLAMACAAEDGRGSGGELDVGAVDGVQELLTAAHELVQRAIQGRTLPPDAAGSISEVCLCKVACWGMTYYLRDRLSDRSFYLEPTSAEGVAAATALLQEVALQQPSLHAELVQLLAAGLAATGASHREASRHFLDLSTSLIKVGEVEGVMRVLDGWARTGEPQAVRGCVSSILEACSPPYSPQFAAWLLRLTRRSQVKRSREGGRKPHDTALLREFALACRGFDLAQPPFAPADPQFLQELLLAFGVQPAAAPPNG